MHVAPFKQLISFVTQKLSGDSVGLISGIATTVVLPG